MAGSLRHGTLLSPLPRRRFCHCCPTVFPTVVPNSVPSSPITIVDGRRGGIELDEARAAELAVVSQLDYDHVTDISLGEQRWNTGDEVITAVGAQLSMTGVKLTLPDNAGKRIRFQCHAKGRRKIAPGSGKTDCRRAITVSLVDNCTRLRRMLPVTLLPTPRVS